MPVSRDPCLTNSESTTNRFQKTFHCAACNNICSEVSLTESLSESNRQTYGLDMKFTGKVWFGISKEQYDMLVREYSNNEFAKIYGMNVEWVPFYCPECKANYCKDHWHRWVTYDDGFYDAEYGICPKGHQRMLFD